MAVRQADQLSGTRTFASGQKSCSEARDFEPGVTCDSSSNPRDLRPAASVTLAARDDSSATMADAEVTAADTAPAADFEDLSQPAAADGTVTTTNTSTEVAAPADGSVEKVKRKKLIKRKRRPARPQQDPATFKTEPPPQTGTIFNIWYAR